jgi:uncharacterized RmlC-like cupin family protein
MTLVSHSYPAGFFGGLHCHNGIEAFHVRSGIVRVTVGSHRQICRTGDLILVPAGAEHGFVVLADAEIDVLQQRNISTYLPGDEREDAILLDARWPAAASRRTTTPFAPNPDAVSDHSYAYALHAA